MCAQFSVDSWRRESSAITQRFEKFSNPLLRRSIDILSDDPAADPAAEPGAAPEVDPAADPTADAAVDPAADLADQVRWRHRRTFLCEERRVVHRLLDILQSEGSSKASHESYRDEVKPETGYLGSCHSTEFQVSEEQARNASSLTIRIPQTPSCSRVYITMKGRPFDTGASSLL